MNLFYTPDITLPQYYLNEDESKHCIRVLRLKKDEYVQLVDGIGGFYKAQIIDDNPRSCLLKVVEHTNDFEKRNYSLHLAIAPTKNTDRLEWFVEKATEIGIDEITPIICEHSERKYINAERLERITVSAMKQSLKAYKPVIHNEIHFKNFILNSKGAHKFIAHCEEKPKRPISKLYIPNNEVTILIGPEGDFSPAEIDLAENAGFSGITLGKSRLRTETAGLVACHTIYLLNS